VCTGTHWCPIHYKHTGGAKWGWSARPCLQAFTVLIRKVLPALAEALGGAAPPLTVVGESKHYEPILMQAVSASVVALGRDGGRGLHSSTSLLNLSRFWHKIHSQHPLILLNTPGHL